MLQYKKRKNGNTDHKKEGNLPPNQNFKRKMVTHIKNNFCHNSR